jgi:O-antigen ligase
MGHWMHFGGQQMLVSCALVAFLLLGNVVRSSTPPRAPKPELRTRNLLWWLVLAIIALSILLNLTRAVWLGCFVAGLYLVGSWKPRWLLVLPVLAGVAFLALPKLAQRRIEILRHPPQEPAISIRFEMWQTGLRMIERHPWVGVGPNNIFEVYTLYLPPGRTPEVGYREHLHNDYLQLAAERGLPCLAAWLWLMGAVGWQFGRIRRRVSARGGQVWVVEAGLAILLAFLTEGLFEFNFGSSPVVMLFLFAISTPFAAEEQSRERLETGNWKLETG